MIITSATPKELINWFHTRQEDQRILCVMLAPAQEDQRRISELVAELYAVDAALGDEVAFLLIHPNAKTLLSLDNDHGKLPTLSGNAFPVQEEQPDLAYPLRRTEVFRDISAASMLYRQEIADESARAMAYFTNDFMRLFGVSALDLPALCVLIKGLDESIVLPLGQGWTNALLLSHLKSLGGIASDLPNFQAEFQDLANELPLKLQSASEATYEIEAELAHIAKILETLLRRYQGNENDVMVIADFIARGCPSQEQLECVLNRLSFSSNERYVRDGQVTKVASLMARVEAIRTELNLDFQCRRYVLSIADRAKQLVERRNQLFQAIQDLRTSRLTKTSKIASGSLGRVRSAMEVINLTGDVGERLLASIDWVRKLL